MTAMDSDNSVVTAISHEGGVTAMESDISVVTAILH